MRLNRGGLIACAIYTLHFVLFFGWALFAGLKTSVVLASIAVFPVTVLGWRGHVAKDERFPISDRLVVEFDTGLLRRESGDVVLCGLGSERTNGDFQDASRCLMIS